MNEQIKVAIVEDQRVHYDALKKDLEYIGCVVVAIATSMVEIIDDLIPKLEELGVEFIFLDNSIEEMGDGQEVANKIRERSSSVIIVGFSSNAQDYVDRPLGKGYMGFQPLKKAIGMA